MAEVYATKINGNRIAASAIVPGSALATQINDMKDAIAALESIGAFQVVSLTTDANPVPDVAEPKTTVIYLTKESGSSKTDPYTEWIYQYEGESSGNGHWEIIGTTSMDLDKYKKVQTPVSVTGGALKGVASFSQNANGDVTLTLNDIQDGTTSQKGVVQLQGTIGASEAEDTKAATPKAVRDAINDLDVAAVTVGASKTLTSISEADGKISTSAVDIQIAEYQVTNLVDDLASKQDNLSFEGTYDASTNKVATESTVSDAIEALDVSAISVGADKTLSSISETDGKISATPVSIQIAESQVTNLTTDLAAKADKVTSATDGNFAGLDSNGNLTDSGSKASDFATAAQGTKADSAIQSVSVNGTALVKDANNGVNVLPATTPTPSGTEAVTGTYGVVQITLMEI